MQQLASVAEARLSSTAVATCFNNVPMGGFALSRTEVNAPSCFVENASFHASFHASTLLFRSAYKSLTCQVVSFVMRRTDLLH